MILIDMTVWSLALRRRRDRVHARRQALVDAWVSLVESGTALLIGPVRQEILSGIRHEGAFNEIRRRLAALCRRLSSSCPVARADPLRRRSRRS